jgi:hypothetical protein
LFPYPEVVVGKAYERIRDGQLTDDETRELLRTMLGRYIDWNRTLVG